VSSSQYGDSWEPLSDLLTSNDGGEVSIREEEVETEASSATPTVTVIGTYIEGQEMVESMRQPPSGESPRTLKINQDLLLYRCRTLRHKAFYVADRAERNRMLQEVEDGLRRAIDMDPTDGRAYVSLGKHYMLQKRYQDAANVYENGCAATQGQNPYIWQAWATLEAKRRNINNARKYYDAAIVASSSHVTAWHGWGQLEKQQGNYVRARELWIKGLQNATTPNEYLFQSLGVLAAEVGRVGEAREWFKRGTQELRGVSAHAIWQAWALLETEYGDESTVRSLWGKGLKANPKSRYIYLSWGTWELNQGQRGRARKILLKGNQVNPRDPAIYQALGVLEYQEGNAELSRWYFKCGLEVDPDHVYLWQGWGVLEWRQGNLEEARRLFQKGIWADPTSRDVSTVFQAWGCLENEGGNVALARNLLKCAVKADPSNEVSWMSWAQLEESRGYYQRANDIRNFSMQERVEVVTPQLTSRDLQVGWEQDAKLEGVGAGSFGQAVQQIARWLKTVTTPPRRQSQWDRGANK